MKAAENSICNIDEDMTGNYICWRRDGENKALESITLTSLTVCCLSRRAGSAQVLFLCELSKSRDKG